jgi:hypothetical protein
MSISTGRGRNMNVSTDEQWLPMREVAKMLDIRYDKLARLARQNTIRSKDYPLDQRVRLVELNEVKKMYGK